MAPRGKHFTKNKRFENGKRSKKSNTTKLKNRRKNYSDDNSKRKRKCSDNNDNLENKRHRILNSQPAQPVQLNEESSDEEVVNYMDRFIATIEPKYIVKRYEAIDTSDEDSSDETDLPKAKTNSLDCNNKITEDDDNERSHFERDGNVNDNQDEDRDEGDNQEEEQELDAETQKEEEENIENLSDPYTKHLSYQLSESLLKSVQCDPMNVETYEKAWPLLGELEFEIPICDSKGPTMDEDDKPFAIPGSVPKRISKTDDSLYIKSQIVNNLANANICGKPVNQALYLTPLQMEMFSIVNNYQDFYYPHRTFENAEEIRFTYCLHVANHLMKSSTKVLHHNAKLLNRKNKQELITDVFQDQGLVRPKVLMVVPFRDSALKIITMLNRIITGGSKGSLMNEKRFMNEFTGHELYMPTKYPKPEDYQKMFSGNIGDDFRIGIGVTRKALKLYANFYSSDVIIASPLGLRSIIGVEGDAKREYDFLASIELLVFDQMEVFLMQNWMYVFDIMKHMHLQLKETHGSDIFRIRKWSLNGLGKYYRQTLLFSSFILPEFLNIFNNRCFNYRGKVKTTNPIIRGSICEVSVALKHVFQKFDTNSFSESVEDRLKFFTAHVLPKFRESHMKQTMVFVPSYFDYIRLRNYFEKNDISFVPICEYSKDSKIAMARDFFFHGNVQILLYTGRFHFFHRIRVKGIRHLIFYQPPIFPHFYTEMCNLMQEKNMNKKLGQQFNMSVTVLYSQYDGFRIASILGTDRASILLQSDKSVHLFT